MSSLVVPARFNGPPHSGNGGWTSGAVAALLHPAGRTVQVRLSAPPPLDVPMPVQHDPESERVVAMAAGTSDAVATASLVASPFSDPPPAPVTWDVAGDAEQRYRGLTDHPFPTCFSCGTARHDGLGLRPGPLTDRPEVTACRWTPDEVDAETTWAALDCPGGWSVDLAGRPMVLGTMTAQLEQLPEPGQRHVVMGRALGQDGRKAWTETALYVLDPAPRVLARATAVWIAVDPAAVRPG
ncbi:hypothetical protein ACPPVT_03995 [Angustibacter sp. McL0619]|uniref:hypothetical protein n=1 Tax=Angustibacter sp. McL0619 TaxID=3415676 RepID=UPI003CED1588